jgi:hypothetical protein
MTYALQDSLSDYPQDEPVLLNNREAWNQLAQERERLAASCYLAGAALIAGATFANPFLTLGVLPPLGGLGIRLQKTNQIYLSLGRLLEKFEKQSVIITPCLDVPDNGSLDLFVRFPNPPKANFAIGLRSNGDSKVFYDPEKENLYVRRRGGGLKPWQVDLFRRIGLQEFWLRKNRQVLFGQSSKDKNRAVVKILVLTGKTKLGQHPEQMYATIGEQKVLLVQKRVAVYLMEESQLIPFIEAWLAKSDTPNNG